MKINKKAHAIVVTYVGQSSVAETVVKLLEKNTSYSFKMAKRIALIDSDKTRSYPELDAALRRLFGKRCPGCSEYHIESETHDYVFCISCRFDLPYDEAFAIHGVTNG